MRIVIGLHSFAAFAGTETYTLTLAEELQRLGHDVVVHARELGPIADVAAARGLTVTEREPELPATCDAVVTQDAGSAQLLGARYPRSRRVLIVHSDYHALQSPPQLPGVCDAVVVLSDRVGRYVAGLAWHPPIIRLRQPVDLRRFGVSGGPQPGARRALILGNYLRGAAAETILGACRDAGLDPVLTGGQTVPTAAAERAIAEVEVVIGLGRCIVEALAGRRAALVFGIAGGDGWVTPERYAELEADGFAGTATPAVVDRRWLAEELARWEPEMGLTNRQLAEQHHSSARHAVELVEQLWAIEPSAAVAPDAAAELARLVRLEWQSWGRYEGVLWELRAVREARAEADAEAARLREQAAALERQLAASEEAAARAAEAREAEATAERAALRVGQEAAAEVARQREAELVAEIAALKGTRRYRLAGRLAAPLDGLRRGRSRRG